MKDNETLIKEIRLHLDQSIGQIDADTERIIRQARCLALEQQTSPRFSWGPLLSGVAASVVIAVALFNVFAPSDPRLEMGQVEVVEMLSSEQSVELFENLNFYTWLAVNPEEHLGS